MTPVNIEIKDALTWEEDLPRPRWDLLESWVESRVEADAREDAWTDLSRQWLKRLGAILGENYQIDESAHFLMLSALPALADHLLWCAEHSREELLGSLPEVTEFSLGKQPIVAIGAVEDYYRYICVYYPDGKHGGSAGCHVREGRPHVVLSGKLQPALESTISHEMTHVALTHLSLPLWLEEGLATSFQKRMTTHDGEMLVTGAEARKQKRYWSNHGLDAFWDGSAFLQAGKVQQHAYQLAEVLMRLLFEEYRPRWFGLAREPRRRLFGFLRAADAADCGQSAAREHLRIELGDLAGRFLGPGEWNPTCAGEVNRDRPPL